MTNQIIFRLLNCLISYFYSFKEQLGRPLFVHPHLVKGGGKSVLEHLREAGARELSFSILRNRLNSDVPRGFSQENPEFCTQKSICAANFAWIFAAHLTRYASSDACGARIEVDPSVLWKRMNNKLKGDLFHKYEQDDKPGYVVECSSI